MYQGDSNILITHVNNGWIVQLPFRPVKQRDIMDFEYGPTAISEEEIRRQTRIQKDEILKDDVLEKIKSENESKPERVPLIELKQETLFVFKTLKEVLKFLTEKYNVAE